MRKTCLYIATSLDGYIANIQGGVEWLKGDDSDKDNLGSYGDFIQNIDTIIMGAITYKKIITELSPDVWPYPDQKTIVLTNKSMESKNDVVFTNQNIDKLVTDLKSIEGKNIWICGGANVANLFIEKDLIDEYTISVMPTILGDGIPLFNKHKNELRLNFVSSKNYNGVCDLVYKRER